MLVEQQQLAQAADREKEFALYRWRTKFQFQKDCSEQVTNERNIAQEQSYQRGRAAEEQEAE